MIELLLQIMEDISYDAAWILLQNLEKVAFFVKNDGSSHLRLINNGKFSAPELTIEIMKNVEIVKMQGKKIHHVITNLLSAA